MNEFLKDFFKRNSPIFSVAFVVTIIFLVTIVLSKNRESARPTLIEIKDTNIVSDHNYALGDNKAKIEIISFLNNECDECVESIDYIYDLYKNNPGLIFWVFKHAPASSNEFALSAQAYGNQFMFWDYITGNVNWADEVGEKEINKIINSEEIAGEVQTDYDIYENLELSTPTFYVNGVKTTSLKDLKREVAKFF